MHRILMVVAFCFGFALMLTFEMLLVYLIDSASGRRVIPVGLGWIFMPVAAGLAAAASTELIQEFARNNRFAQNKAVRLTSVLIAAWMLGCFGVYYMMQPYGYYVSRAAWQNFLGWLSIPPGILVFVIGGAYWAGVVGQSQQASEQDFAKTIHTECEQCVAQISQKWLHYNNALKFKSDVRLSNIIEGFALPTREFVRETHPLIYALVPSLFWMIVFRGIQQTGMPSFEEINHAITELDAKLRGKLR
ncbi:MAG: hypothetical protein KGQ37_01705 [Hyphomicrobiales bacterium]|nr:hypothetical protein [Hyphomicrobiales bacterium]